MLMGSLDAVGGLHLPDVMEKPKFLESSKCEYPPKRVGLQDSVYIYRNPSL